MELFGRKLEPVDWARPRFTAGEIIVFTTYDYESFTKASRAREAGALPYIVLKAPNIPGIEGEVQGLIAKSFL